MNETAWGSLFSGPAFLRQVPFPLAQDVLAAIAAHCPKQTDHAINETPADSYQGTTAAWTCASGHLGENTSPSSSKTPPAGYNALAVQIATIFAGSLSVGVDFR